MRILMVTPYPPLRDGIATYAVQQVAALRAAGHDVEVLSPGPSAAHYHLDLVGPRGGLALAKRVGAYDLVVVQFHPDFFYPMPSSARERMATSAGLLAAFTRARRVEVVVHEIDYRHGALHSPDGAVARAMWRAVDRVVVHTESERVSFARGFGYPPERIEVREHGQSFVRRTALDTESARASLGIGPGEFTFLCIGFVAPHKGFDRAVRAFSGLAPSGARLDIVGSVRGDEPDLAGYANQLAALAEATEGAHLHLGYVTDELFDRWLAACDCVVLPYRFIFSSGVLERAALYGRPAIATAVGGLAEQAGGDERVRLVADDQELRAAMWAACGASARAAQPRSPWPADGPDLAARVQDEVRRRAALERGSTLVRTGSGTATAPLTVVSAPVRRLGTLQLPPPTSTRTGAAFVKRTIRRLTAWQLEPVVGYVNALSTATAQAVERGAAAGEEAAYAAGGSQRHDAGETTAGADARP